MLRTYSCTQKIGDQKVSLLILNSKDYISESEPNIMRINLARKLNQTPRVNGRIISI